MSEKTIQNVIDEMTDEQRAAAYALAGIAMESVGDEMEHSEISFERIIEDGQKIGSLKEAIIQHAGTYGIDQIEILFPDAQNITKEPMAITNNIGWVSNVMSGVYKPPFARVKSTWVDLTIDDVRARGYAKGKRKAEEVISILKRTTMPTTIYKKQKLDRDDIIDITDFSVVGWIKRDMRIKLDEEIARCVLIGDGRLTTSDDYIDRECIRPIHTDEDIFSIKVPVVNDVDKYKNFIKEVKRSRKKYKGSGDPTLYIGEDVLCELLLLTDLDGRYLYPSAQDLAKVLRVSDIVSVPVLDGVTRTDAKGVEQELLGIIVNLRDYSVGSNQGGKVAMFEDFDIDYNQQKYLIETRCSGALTVPLSAMVIETPVPVAPAQQSAYMDEVVEEEIIE